ncbi:MAG: CCA tRNA nucleotidyltransferase, partial [Planctomycetaceae bacterium]|nr:CCA tRNA nucleotidyltransferase [Planctomycetaceae bacterium]
AGIVRAIGNPGERFAEDKLRMLRAVRFAATMGFEIDPDTQSAILRQHQSLRVVSVERITQELKRMLSHPSRERALQMLWETRLLREVLPELFATFTSGEDTVDEMVRSVVSLLAGLKADAFEPSIAGILVLWHRLITRSSGIPAPEIIECICRRLRLSNDEQNAIEWLARSLPLVEVMQQQPLHIQKPLLADVRMPLLIDFLHAIEQQGAAGAQQAEFCRQQLRAHPSEYFNPVPLIDGRTLQESGIAPGKAMGLILRQIRREQLDEILRDRDAAIQRACELAGLLEDQGST